MENLVELQSQIEKLQKRAADIKAKEFNNTVADILAKMEAFGISIQDLQSADKRKTRRGKTRAKASGSVGRRRSSANKGTKVAAKYKGPNGETWSGRGLPPKWMSALLAQGRNKEEFAIRAA